MSRWEIVVLNKLYKTELFNQIVETPMPSQLYQFCVQQLKAQPEKDYKLIELADDSITIKDNRELYKVVQRIANGLSAQRFGEDVFSFMDVIMFSALSRCKIWPKIFKSSSRAANREFMNMQLQQESFDQKKNQQMKPLLSWYQCFLSEFSGELEWKFDKTILTEKYIKMVEKRQIIKKSHPQLFKALQDGEVEQIREIMMKEERQLLNYVENQTLMKAVHYGCLSGKMEVVRLLDELNPDWEDLDGERQTPLFFGIQSGSLEICRFLIEERSVQVDYRECQSRTPLYLACFLGHKEILEYLYSKGANINAISKLKRTPLSKACYLNHVEIVEWLLDKKGINILQQDNKGRTALHNAAWGVQGGKDVNQNKQNINLQGKKRGDRLLPDSPRSIVLLLKQGHPVDLADLEGNTSLQSATSSNAIESVDILIGHGADKEHQNIYGETPLWLAARFGHIDILKQLIVKYQCSITTPDFKGITPLFISTLYNQKPITKLLLNLLLESNNALSIDISKLIQLSIQNNKLIELNSFLKYLNKQLQSKTYSYSLFFGKEEDIFNQQLKQQYLDTYLTFAHLLIEYNFINKSHYYYQLIQNIPLETIHYILYKSTSSNLFQQKIIGSDYFTPNHFCNLLLQSPQIEDQSLLQLLTDLNQSILEAESDLIHILIKQRRVKVILEIFKLIQNDEYYGKFQPNLIHLLTNHKFQDLTAIQLALALKQTDICHLIDDFLKSSSNQQQFSNYYIPKYEIQIKQLLNQKQIDINCYDFKTDFFQQITKERKNQFIMIEDEQGLINLYHELQQTNMIAVDIEFYQEGQDLGIITQSYIEY